MDRSRSKRWKCRPVVEALGDRCLLSGSGLTPAQVTSAYGLSGLSFGGQTADGSGQTIALVDAYNDPNIAAELAAFDSANNLPAPPSLTILGESGSSTLPRTDSGWAREEALDVEWAHAIAPGAGLVLVEASSTRLSDFMTAVKTAASQPGVTVVSMSWGEAESSRTSSYDSYFSVSGVSFVAASGDEGPSAGAQWPASSQSVVGVGGTTLQVSGSGAYGSETAWTGSSGGYSMLESEPAYQAAVQSSGMRGVPDVAFDANPNTGVEVYTIDPNSGQGGMEEVGGTSLGAPAWAGLIALADQGRALSQMGTLSSAQTLTALYSLPSSDFHIIGGGYNTQTGLGTPSGAALIDGLVSSAAIPTSPPVTTPPPVTPPVGVDPVVPLPIITAPISTVPVIPLPVNTAPVATAPVTTTTVGNPSTNGTSAPVTQTSLTPPPAPSPVNPLHKKAKKNVKHVVAHPRPKVHHVKAHTLHAQSSEPRSRA